MATIRGDGSCGVSGGASGFYSPAKEKAANRGVFNNRSSSLPLLRRIRLLLICAGGGAAVRLKLLVTICLFLFIFHFVSSRAASLMGWVPHSPSSAYSPSRGGYTVLINTWKRNSLLKQAVAHYASCSGTDAIRVVWSENDPPSNSLKVYLRKIVLSKSSAHKTNFRFDLNEEDNLNNRFKPIEDLSEDNKFETRKNRAHGFRENLQRDQKKSHRTFSRQVSLETGFSALNREPKNNKNGAFHLPRSGRSLGGLGATARVGEGRKGDFSIFRTKSTLHKQNSLLPTRAETETQLQKKELEEAATEEVPAGRYFAALRGAELDEVKDSEDILLPKDEKWPFLLRFPIGCFGICLGLSSQAILWGNLAHNPAFRFLNITPLINIFLWFLATITLISVSLTYILKCIFYLEAVRREYYHPVRINFFFAPWIACMFLAIGLPPSVSLQLHPAIWCIFMAPVFLLELKIYGQWLSGGKRRLCKVANPSCHLSVVGNFVGAILAARVGWYEAGKFFWAVGFAHYLVVFVTLYQRLPTSEALPKELHPVYSMFITVPCAASIAWQAIYGEFDSFCRICYFTALFLYISLVVRINFFRGFRFSVAWWSYTFPMTTASVATIKYAEAVPCALSKGLALTLALMSSAMVSVILVSTLLHALVWQSLFPNDLAIAITKNKNNFPKLQIKEKRPFRRAYNIRRWTKQSSFLNISSKIKNSLNDEDLEDGDNKMF